MKKSNPPKPTIDPLEVPATFATQVNLRTTNDGWRLTFGEAINEFDAAYFTAVFLPISTAHQLIDLMVSQRDVNKNKAG